MTPTVSVCIDARLTSGASGGVETVIVGLAQGLRAVADPGFKLTFLCLRDGSDWLRPHLDPAWKVVEVDPTPGRRWARRLGPLAGVLRPGYRLLKGRGASAAPAALSTARSDGTLEALGVDLVHFPFQEGFVTSVPSIYQPHDLQHVHLPDFFSVEERARREEVYGTLCRQARRVVVGTSWVATDVREHFALPEDRVRVIPLAPVSLGAGSPVDGSASPLPPGVAEPFAFYPAATWPHKNHLRLVQAVGQLRDAGLVVRLVLSGGETEHAGAVRAEVERLELGEQIRMVGFVTSDELAALYACARLVVVPTLFESASYPVWEAFRLGAPVACSAVTSLPAQTGTAAELFDPLSVTDIARAVRAVWLEDGPAHRRRVEEGRRRLEDLSVERTARMFLATYRDVAGVSLEPQEAALLAAPPTL